MAAQGTGEAPPGGSAFNAGALRGTRFPFIGTYVATLPAPVVFGLYRSIKRQPFLNLELHGVDLIDESDGTGAALPWLGGEDGKGRITAVPPTVFSVAAKAKKPA